MGDTHDTHGTHGCQPTPMGASPHPWALACTQWCRANDSNGVCVCAVW